VRYTGMRQEYVNDHIDKRLKALESPVDYEAKYNELRSAIQEELRFLRPWYVGGSVMNPISAIEALKAIDRLVKQ
jgi:hypothetical protein